MIVSLPYGRTHVGIEVPDGAELIEPLRVRGLPDERRTAHDAFRAPLGSPSLRDIVSRGDRVAIVISDATRPLPSERIIPWILEELDFLPPDAVTVIVGVGSHRPSSETELGELTGGAASLGVRCVNHNAFDNLMLARAGRLGSGIDIFLNRLYCEATVRITVGFIEPHFFAGFSGGPKAVMPGIAGIEEIRRFHGAAMIDHPLAETGVLEGNPVYEMAAESALLRRPDFSINVTLNMEREITRFFCGDLIGAHRAGAEFTAAHSRHSCDGPFDIVITSNAGHPLDRNLYQAVKGINAAASIVKKGGSIICAARCEEGVPDNGDFCEILGMAPSPGELLKMIRDPGFSRIEQWQAQKLAAVLTRAAVHLYSGLSEGTVTKAHMIPCGDVTETLDSVMKKNRDARVAVLRYGPMSIPYISNT